jgi:hypothetical protein
MEVWGPHAHLVAGTRRRGGASRPHPLLHLINSFSLHVAWLAASAPSPANLAGLAVPVSLLRCFCLCVKCCPVNVRVTSLISVTRNAFGPHRGNRTPKLSSTSVLPPVLLWHLTGNEWLQAQAKRKEHT